ncbi:unnamed protein product [Scytosiphon promiscuus]
MESSIIRCSACLQEGEASDFTHTRRRTGQKIRTFVDDDAGVSEKFPGFRSDDGDANTLILCKRAEGLLELFKKHEQSEIVERAEGKEKRKLDRRPAWTPAPEPSPDSKRRRFDQYGTSPEAARALLDAVTITGRVLGMCGGPEDAVAARLRGTCEVLRSDAISKLSWDTDPRTALLPFAKDFLAANSGSRPDWVLVSPPYKGALAFVQVALSLATEGVAIKVPLSFLEPCRDRGLWLQNNPPARCIFLRRVQHSRAHLKAGEFWGVWYTDRGRSGGDNGARFVFC